MAGFKTHITTSTVLGIGYGSAAAVFFDVPIPACLLAGGLCSVSGMLPDLDSGPGRPLRESTAFAAAVVPMLLLDRFRAAGWPTDTIILAGAGIYLAIRFGVHWLLSRYTVHRGMFHSLPACLIAAELTMLAFGGNPLELRYFKAGGVVLGFMSHLVLDELWSIEWRRGRLAFKKSFGTAIKLWSDSWWANVSTYGKVAILTFLCLEDPTLRENLEQRSRGLEQIAGQKMRRELETTGPAAEAATPRTAAAPSAARRLWDRLLGSGIAEAPAPQSAAGYQPVQDLPLEALPPERPAPAAPLGTEEAARFGPGPFR